MSEKTGIIAGILVLLLATCERAPVPVRDGSVACSASFRKFSSELIEIDVSPWKIQFSVALIGCIEDLDTLTPKEMRRIRSELKEPSEWSILKMYIGAIDDDSSFRAKVTARLNELLGRDAIAGILIYHARITEYFYFPPEP
ncbi:MAG: hypothetical protein GY906_34805 [bacterium]|nr:hypothetical protein [bacterium]